MKKQFGKYELIQKIGAGGMAEVFLAKSFGAEGLEKTLVIKRILPEFLANTRFIEMFIAEAKIAMGLNHPNIVQIYDFGKVGQDYYLAMEHVDGTDLGQLLRACHKAEAPLSIGDAIFVGIEVLKGLDYAHRRKDEFHRSLELVHRDISPQNVLVSDDGTIKLVDFGIAKATSVAEEHPGLVKGKYSYMSPEQATGAVVDQRSDLFSFGAVLFELVCGRALFGQSSHEETLSLVKSAVVPDIASLNPNVPSQLEGVLYKLLAREPEERYQTAREIQMDLTRVLYGLGQIHDSVTVAGHLQEIKSFLAATSSEPKRTASSTSVHTAMTNIARTSATTANLATQIFSPELSDASIVAAREIEVAAAELLTRQRKEVVIIVGELLGLLELREVVSEERWVQVLQEYTRIVDSIAFKNDAVIHRVDEDGFVLLLGIPVSSENDSERATRMALDLHEAMAGMNLSLECPLQVCIGMAIGEVVLEQEAGGRGRRYNWSFFGESHELAERLAQLAMAREVLTGSQVYQRIRRDFDCEELAGVVETNEEMVPVQAYRLLSPKSMRDQFLELRRSYHSFYGREIPRRLIRASYREVLINELAAAMIIIGPPGVGKSTLIDEFLAGLDSRHVRVVRGVVDPYDRDVPLACAGALFAEVLRLGERRDLRALRDTLEERVRALFPDEDDHEHELLMHSLGAVFNVKLPPGCFEGLAGDERRGRIFLSLQKLMTRVAGKKPLVLAIDDAHNIDMMTLAFMAQVFNSRQMAPIFFLSTAADTGPHIGSRPWQELLEGQFVKVELLPELQYQEAQAMVQGLLEVHQIEDEQLVEEILRRSGGNPLYIKEIVELLADRGLLTDQKLLSEQGLLESVDEPLQIAGSNDEPSWVPASIEGLLSARVDRLEVRLKVALRRLSLLWSPFSFKDAEFVLGENGQEMIDELVTNNFLARADLPDLTLLDTYDPASTPEEARTYRFANALLQEVAARSIVPQEAVELHRAIAEHLVLHRDDLAANASALIARHFDGARDAELAVRFYIRAAQDAFEHYGARECVRLCDRVLERATAEGQGESAPSDADGAVALVPGRPSVPPGYRIQAMKLKEQALHELGLAARSKETLDKLAALVQEAGKRADRLDVALRKARSHYDAGDFDAARSLVEEALAVAEEEPADERGKADAWRMEAMISMTEGRHDLALELIERALPIYIAGESPEDGQGMVAAYNLRGVILRQAGRHHEALATYDEALRHARTNDHAKLARYLLINSGLAKAHVGQYAEALSCYGVALEQARRLGHRREEAALLVNIGHARLLMGNTRQAMSEIQAGIDLAQKTTSAAILADGHISLGACCLEMGELAWAEEAIQKGLHLADSIPHRYLSIHGTLALAQLKLAAGTKKAARVAQVLAEYALERSRASQMRWGVAYASSLIARAQKLRQKSDLAIESSRRARDLVEEGEIYAVEEILFWHFQVLPETPQYQEERVAAITRAREIILERRAGIPEEADRAAYMNRSICRKIIHASELLKIRT